MRSNLSQEEFFQKMKKKPALQAILDHLDQYTEKELKSIHGQPLWIRQILVKMKTNTLECRSDEEVSLSADLIANEMTKNTNGQQIEPKHEIRRWISGTWLMSCGITGGMTIEINPDDLFIITDPKKHFISISSSYSTLNQQEWNYFLQNTVEVGIMTRSEYAKLVSDKLSKNFVDHEAIAKLAGPKSYVDPNSNKGFEIIRHPVK